MSFWYFYHQLFECATVNYAGILDNFNHPFA